MNIYYTEEFKKDLSRESSKLVLDKYGLRYKNLGVPSLDYILSSDDIKSSPINGYYTPQIVNYGNAGIQISIEIPSTDVSFYNAEDGIGKTESYYQSIIFYYSNLSSPSPDEIKTAFILYQNFNDGLFSGLNLSTLKNIITITELPNKRCELIFNQSDLTESLESKAFQIETTRDGSDGTTYVSRKGVEFDLDTNYNNDQQPYYGTTLINKYGLKLY